MQVAAAALLPAQSLFENAWQVTVHRVQSEFTKMQTTLVGMIDAEKGAHARTLDACARMRHELEDALEERKMAHKERERLRGEVEQVVGENEALRIEMRRMLKDAEEARTEGKRLGVENGLLREGWGIANAVKSKVIKESNGDHSYPPGLMDKVQEHINHELETRVAKRSSFSVSFTGIIEMSLFLQCLQTCRNKNR